MKYIISHHKDGTINRYDLDKIDEIVYGKIEEFAADIIYKDSGFKKGDAAVQGYFKDGLQSVFGCNWSIEFE